MNIFDIGKESHGLGYNSDNNNGLFDYHTHLFTRNAKYKVLYAYCTNGVKECFKDYASSG